MGYAVCYLYSVLLFWWYTTVHNTGTFLICTCFKKLIVLLKNDRTLMNTWFFCNTEHIINYTVCYHPPPLKPPVPAAVYCMDLYFFTFYMPGVTYSCDSIKGCYKFKTPLRGKQFKFKMQHHCRVNKARHKYCHFSPENKHCIYGCTLACATQLSKLLWPI